MDDEREKLAMNKLKDFILSRLAALNPYAYINFAHVSFTEHRLRSLFNNSFHSLIHPPYPLMIKRVMVKLNAEGESTGSTEETISEIIRREYEDLPLAHVRILDIHLRKLCLNTELVRSENRRYVLVDCDEMDDDDDDFLGGAATEEHSEA